MTEPLIMLKITEAAQKYNVAVHAIRSWVINGELPAVRTGIKYLICEDVLREFLMKGNNHKTANETSGKIRRVY